MKDLKEYPITIAEVVRARSVVRRFIKPTQLIRYEGLSRAVRAEVYVKHENHNPTGSFKIRGGVNLLHHLGQKDINGVITFSTGNHGLSIATAAAWSGIGAVVVVPENNNPAKNRAIMETGAELIEAGRTFEEAAQIVDTICAERGLYYAHPADEPHLINGVGTEFLEIIEDLPDIDVMIVPIGAGSEAAAAITTLRVFRPHVEVIAVQAKSSPAAYHSWREKKIVSAENDTFAGGFATGKAYETPFAIYSKGLSDFVLLTEDEIYESIGMALHYTHNLAEGAGASTLMAAIKLKDHLKGKKVALQMSGCNASAEEISTALSYPAPGHD
ncbi:MAG TPA: pyridoxal-phosphate dependent enzyme [Syntrophales bacterium]|nr:pyridoxal-phosphate dependent enzyme [Syntrophales bacterium]HPQ43971.1 pyridoxal-phosphate dependent enzyme [Syntrophales bacterium]